MEQAKNEGVLMQRPLFWKPVISCPSFINTFEHKITQGITGSI